VIPNTPPKIKAQRELQATKYIENIEGDINRMEELYNSATQMWKKLQEDEKVQELDQKERNINTSFHDLKHIHKNMAILNNMKIMQEMKNPQA